MLKWQIISLVHKKTDWGISKSKWCHVASVSDRTISMSLTHTMKSKMTHNLKKTFNHRRNSLETFQKIECLKRMFTCTSMRKLLIQPCPSLINKCTAISCCVSPVSMWMCVWQMNTDSCISRVADDNDRTWWADRARCRCPDHMDGYCCASPSPPQMVPAATQHNKT